MFSFKNMGQNVKLDAYFLKLLIQSWKKVVGTLDQLFPNCQHCINNRRTDQSMTLA